MAQKKKGDNARIKSSVLREMNVEELRKRLSDEKEALMRARFQHATAALEDTAKLKTTRRQIARIETILKQKEQGS